jgi:hypothetical protein
MADMTVASTTDTQAEINRAAGVMDKPEVEKPETEETTQPETEQTKPETDSEAQPSEHRSKSGFQKRIDKLTRERHADRDRLAALEAELQSIKGAKPAVVEETKPAVEADPEPKEADFTDFKEFTKALARWTFRQEKKEQDTKTAEQSAQEKFNAERKAEFDAHLSRLDEARERYDDFDDVADRVQRSGSFQLPQATQVAIVGAENSGDVVYYLMKHPEVCKKILGMNDARAVMEIGRISAQLEPREAEAEEEEEMVPVGAPRPKKTSTAPAPIRPVSGSATRSSVPLDELSYQDYRRIRDQQDKARYRR